MNDKKRRNGKVIKMNQTVKINAAVIIFAVILVYVIISIFLSLRKEPITTYKVSKSNINNNISCTGIAIRSENIITTDKSGYVSYYVRDGERISRNKTVCTVDESGNTLELISESVADTVVFTDEDYKNIRDTISLYKMDYSDEEFINIYNFKNSIDNKVLELSNEILMQQATSDNSVQASLDSITASESGIITYYVDGMENLTPSTVTKEDFDKTTYEKTTLKTGEVVTANTAVFKIIADENWNIVCMITNEQAELLPENSNLKFIINNSNYQISAPYELIQGDDCTYINISLKKYMTNYVSERYLNIEIILDQYEGLKIPNTSITEKTVYKIPVEYMAQGANQSSTSVVYVQDVLENGEVTTKAVEPDIYKSDDEFYYVDPNDFSESDVIVQLETNNTISVSLLSTDVITGVYLANKGTADFVMINITKTGDEFSIISDNDKLREFDNIILNSDGIIENQIIY